MCVHVLLARLHESTVRLAHGMDVLDVHKVDLSVLVVELALEAFTGDTVGLSVHLRPAVEYSDVLDTCRLTDGIDELLILRTSLIVHSNMRLTTTPYRLPARGMLPRTRWHSTTRSELSYGLEVSVSEVLLGW